MLDLVACNRSLLLNVDETLFPFFSLNVFYSSVRFGVPVVLGHAPAVTVVANESPTAGGGQTVVARTGEGVVAASRTTPSRSVEASRR